VAYLTSEDSVTNTFTVGKVQIKLDETDVYDEGDTYINDEGKEVPVTKEMIGEVIPDATERVKENDYQLYPDKAYTKDPMITVDSNSEDCWVTAKVTVTADSMVNLRSLIGYEGGYLGIDEIVSGGVFDGETYQFDGTKTWTSDNYILVQEVFENKNVFYVYVKNAKKANDTVTLFTTLSIPKEWDNDELAKLEGLEMNVEAFAVQMDGFDDAKTAFDTAFPADAEYNN